MTQDQINQQSLSDPQPGDFWHERFSPYFLIVEKIAQDRFHVLSYLQREGEPCARRAVGTDHWEFDYSKHFAVDIPWIQQLVRYPSRSGFVADVVRTRRTLNMVDEWRQHQASQLRQSAEQAQQDFVGWSALANGS
jgi:hypothetical protein